MNIGILASHEGTTLQCVLDACADGRVPAQVVLVISNNGSAGALVRAREAGVPTIHLSLKTHPEPLTRDAAIRDALVAASVDLVFLAGYMKKLGPLTLGAFPGRILNTHPALLPQFGGQGMYGDRVFEAVLESGEQESGVSVHVVDSDYDAGPVIAQCRLPVLRGDSPETLKGRVRERERLFVVETLAAIASGTVALDGLAPGKREPLS
jgi:phosphoribosylglycinamide formyltransferase 1